MVKFPLGKMPMCEICGKRPGFRVLKKNPGGYIAVCNQCYNEQTQPVMRGDLKNIIKEAIKEYASQKS